MIRDAEEIEGALAGVADNTEIVQDASLGEGTLDEGIQRACLGARIGRDDGAFSMGVADGGLEVFDLPPQDFPDLRADGGVLGADLAAKAEQRAAEDAPAFRAGGGLAVQDIIEVIAEALERWHLRGEHLVEESAFGLPIGLESLRGEGRFGIKEMIETALAHAGLEANGVH